ncbi:MAG: aminodeoxychorismate synthase component I [Chloroflexi bacterium]|nr:aminodeoxychorismate synthase component I [Chloroflexota bacterium]
MLLYDRQQARWLWFNNPLETLIATEFDQLRPLLARVEGAVREQRQYAAGVISYEAALAFDPALQTQAPDSTLPLAWFALYRQPQVLSALPAPQEDAFTLGPWQANETAAQYRRVIARIKGHIADGDTYQVNYTFRLRSDFSGDPWHFFLVLAQAQPACYSAYLDGGDFVICSASPELFFSLNDDMLRSKPMKGTAPRGRSWLEDEAQIAWLRDSAKNQAENVMIVDMIRNDMSRVAEVGSVQVPRLFEVERYPTLLQMTSTVTARTTASLPQIFEALFPCASITGAPKVRTMQLIRSLEATPRGVYTGSIGFVAPTAPPGALRAQFNVAIRTAVVHRPSGRAEYGVGSGIVWDSQADDEYEECRVKTHVLTQKRPDFSLLESLRWEPANGYWLLQRHLRRLQDSAAYFGVPLFLSDIRQRLTDLAASLPATPHKVRLLVSLRGEPSLQAEPLPVPDAPPLRRVGWARQAIDSGDAFLFHKTTRRAVYTQALAARPDCDDVLLTNERGEISETCTANIVLKLDGEWLTPPVASGLLAGTLRQELLARGTLREQVLMPADLRRATEIYAINSVRGWMPVCWVDDPTPVPGQKRR